MPQTLLFVNRRRFLATLVAAGMTAPASLPASAAPASAGNAAPSDTILVLGDSLSAEYGLARGTGWVALLERRLAQQHTHWTLVNASISGETSAGGRSRIDALLQKHRPRVVIIELGGNDALRGLDLRGTEANLDYLAAAAHAIGARVLMIGMMVPPNYGPAYADAFAQIFTRVAARHQAGLVPFFLERIADDMRWFQADRIHPGAEAQPLLLDTVWPALAPMLDEAAAAATSPTNAQRK